MDRILATKGQLLDGEIKTFLSPARISKEVMDNKRIVVVKNVFPPDLLQSLRQNAVAWGMATPAAADDDFRSNYHRQRAMVSRLQQAPHVFHDYNFNDMAKMPQGLRQDLFSVFDPLRRFYNVLTNRRVDFDLPDHGPYLHPQIIHYPNGGGFFARHWHNLQPQTLGFITILSEKGVDYDDGATVFDIDGEIVDTDGHQGLGDICIWRYDYPHWVKQSSLHRKFDWNSQDGRWVATLAYFDPQG